MGNRRWTEITVDERLSTLLERVAEEARAMGSLVQDAIDGPFVSTDTHLLPDLAHELVHEAVLRMRLDLLAGDPVDWPRNALVGAIARLVAALAVRDAIARERGAVADE